MRGWPTHSPHLDTDAAYVCNVTALKCALCKMTDGPPRAVSKRKRYVTRGATLKIRWDVAGPERQIRVSQSTTVSRFHRDDVGDLGSETTG
jgi:hypothetical protein